MYFTLYYAGTSNQQLGEFLQNLGTIIYRAEFKDGSGNSLSILHGSFEYDLMEEGNCQHLFQ